ncbi:MAG: hydrogenase maturation nickel metallochaperone HypA [Endomicrobiia bacterium]
MHEHTLAKNLGYLIFKKIKENKPKKIKKIVFIIGEASGVEKEFLEHSFKEHIFKNTICEQAELVFKTEKPKIKCKKCNEEYKEAILKCNCGSINFDIMSGKDVYIEEIEME